MARSNMQLNLPPLPVQSLDRPRSTPVQNMDRQGEWDALPATALGKAGLSGKAAAIAVPCDQSLLSARLAAKKHLPWSHLRAWGPAFARELVLLVMAFYDLQIGVSEQDRRDMETGRALRELVARVR